MRFDFFETIVAGENPQELMKGYDSKIKVDPYILYKKKDADSIKAKYVHEYSLVLDSDALSENDRERAEEIIHNTLKTPSEAFFDGFTEDFDHDADGNAISTINPKGKWAFYQNGKLFSVPFTTIDGREVYQARKGDVDWKRMHLYGQEVYERAWEMVMEGSKPENDYEKTIFENMKNRTAYFSNFADKKTYVTYSTAFWGYAFLSEENGWTELEEGVEPFDWVSTFYEKFIKPLPDDTLLTIFECKK